MDLTRLKGVGPKRKQMLMENGIHTLDDVWMRFPHRYDERRLQSPFALEGESGYFEVKVVSRPRQHFIRRNLSRLLFDAEAESHRLRVTIFNQRYLARLIHPGARLVVHGRLEADGTSVLARRIFEKRRFQSGILPIYNLRGIADRTFNTLVKQALSVREDTIRDPLPEDLRKQYRLLHFKDMAVLAHAPRHARDVHQVRRRLKYGELLAYQLKVQTLRYLRQQASGEGKRVEASLIDTFESSLPFTLSDPQKEAARTIFADLASPSPMRRLLQGDTGSGKTVVALLAAYLTIQAGYQVAFMAPTELLASQHARTAETLLGKHVRLARLSSGLRKEARDAVRTQLRTHAVDFVVGTHALFTENTEYAKLGLVITDEQHRFGVNQRQRLSAKGELPDVLHLSATPIPRTLAMTLFGDMDITTIQGRPSGQKGVPTTVVDTPDELEAALSSELSKGGRVFVVAPRIDSDDTVEGVLSLQQHYRERFPGKVALLHGRMSDEKKQQALSAFESGHKPLLVATTIIEVGIDIEAATAIGIHHAERFGFAQLHQLRGRVGRGRYPGRCFLLNQGDSTSRSRLEVLEHIHDGFELSERDLQHRGFGDLVGVRQSGAPYFQYADAFEDYHILRIAKSDAERLLQRYLDNEKDLEETFAPLQKLFETDDSSIVPLQLAPDFML